MTDKKATSLDQLSRIDKEAVRSRKTLMLDINLLELPRELNIRYAGLGYDEYWQQPHVKEYVSKLAKDYADGDIFPPIVVKFDADTQKAIIIDGAHRYKAILEANEEHGAEIIRHAVTDSKGDEAKNILLMLNTGQRLDVSAVEIAEGLARLEAFGFTVEEIAKKVSKTVQYVYYMKKVNDLPIETKKLIRQKKLTVTKALAGDKPKRYVPPKKAVNKILDIVAEAQPEINGDSVSVSIPLELYNLLFDPNMNMSEENQE
ncbi:ParB/RepB/Spo0J family partition protein [Proteus mirabilis]|uniref:ParB/RepB/Spo0J family partition protein n=1 Tax=Proteus mirabilis TaxID=584 RepID=UPI000D8618B8|nr:hypothetical protein [Proteus mirabilis]EMA4642802.1 hypothetical protein [Proteus mirabilis]MBG5962200.1 hypothetical protein [Proteus mirabilis]MBL1397245.1 hypothetical protein [Proteus mirabilis]MBQ0656124.1 hypothetical protein [Proteus mirabilis]MDL2104956.1 hypothetical protein [Proteus mirabilis]